MFVIAKFLKKLSKKHLMHKLLNIINYTFFCIKINL